MKRFLKLLTISFTPLFPALASASDDPWCVAINKFANFWPFAKIAVPAVFIAVMLISGGFFIKRERIATGLIVVISGVVIGVILAGVLGRIDMESLRSACIQ